MFRLRLAGLFCWLFGAFLATSAALTERVWAQAAVLNQKPQLAIEVGMHVAPIRRIGASSDCKLLVTGASDKTVRLWRFIENPTADLSELRLVRTLRPPIDLGEEGKVTAVALSRDGRLVAVGGLQGTSRDERSSVLYVFDASSGAIVRSIRFKTSINHLAFAPDGRFLAGVFSGGAGVRVWETSEWAVIAEDSDYNHDSYGAAFDGKGILFTVALDGYVRRYTSDFKLAIKSKTQAGKEAYSVAVNPAGDRIAVGYTDTRAVEVFSSQDLSLSVTNESEGQGPLFAVAWSADGYLFAAGSWFGPEGSRFRVWAPDGQAVATSISGSSNTILNLVPCGEGIAYAGADPSFGVIWSKATASQPRVQPDHRSQYEMFAVSESGGQVRFGLDMFGNRAVLFDVETLTLKGWPVDTKNLFAADSTTLDIKDWRDKQTPTLGGKSIKLDWMEMSRALAIEMDRSRFVLGTEFKVRAYWANGEPVWPAITSSSPVWGVNVTRNKELIVATFADGTIRWYRLKDGQPLLNLFVDTRNLRWVAWTPTGYYVSFGDDPLIGWHLNRSSSEAADFFPASRFHDQFYRPDIVKRVLLTLDENEAVRLANLEAQREHPPKQIETDLPPVVSILSHEDGSPIVTSDLSVRFSVRSPSGTPISRVFALVDGHPVKGAEVKDIALSAPNMEIEGALRVRVPPRDFRLSLIAETAGRASEAKTVELHWEGPYTTSEKPILYALVIGAGRYDRVTSLGDFPAKDADYVVGELLKQKGLAFRDVVIKTLKDRQVADGSDIAATRDNIFGGLQWLRQVEDSRDVAVVFFSGHGSTVDGASYLAPVDFDENDPIRTGIHKVVLRDALRRVNGTRLLILDACYAGTFDTTELSADFGRDEFGITTLASSLKYERSYGDAKGSFFTRALMEVMKGQDRERARADREISTHDIEQWLKKRVPGMVKRSQKKGEIRRQTPFLFKPALTNHIRLSIVK